MSWRPNPLAKIGCRPAALPSRLSLLGVRFSGSPAKGLGGPAFFFVASSDDTATVTWEAANRVLLDQSRLVDLVYRSVVPSIRTKALDAASGNILYRQPDQVS